MTTSECGGLFSQGHQRKGTSCIKGTLPLNRSRLRMCWRWGVGGQWGRGWDARLECVPESLFITLGKGPPILSVIVSCHSSVLQTTTIIVITIKMIATDTSSLPSVTLFYELQLLEFTSSHENFVRQVLSLSPSYR